MRKRGFLCGIAGLLLAGSSPGLSVPAEPASPELPAPPSALANIPVYLAVDAGSGAVLAARRPDLSFVPASLTKVMSVYLAFELIAQGKLRPDQQFALAEASWRRWHDRGTSMHLKPGENVPVDMLLHGMTTVSANDACVALAEGYAGSIEGWAALMNAEARRLGMRHSRFASANGWPDGGQTYVSARDLVRLGEAMIRRHPALYARYFGKKRMVWNGIAQENHDPTIGVIPGADGIKTGFTREAGYGFLGSAVRDGRRVLIVIGGAHSEAERAEAARTLLAWSFAEWRSQRVFARGAPVASAKVQGGAARSVGLLASQDIAITLPRGKPPQVRMTLRYRGPLMAPLSKGAEVAELEIKIAGMAPSRIPLVAATGVSEAGPFDRLRNGLAGLWE